MERFAALYAASDSAIFVWSMGLTQHAFGSDNVRAVINLALARGNVGREGAGLMPIRGHSGVQGGAEMGAYATALPGGVAAGRRLGRGGGRALGLRPAGRAGAHRRGDGGGRRRRPARGALLERRQLPGHAPRPRARRRPPGPDPGAGAPGHRPDPADAGGPRRGGGAAARRHPLRAARRRHRDHHRAPHRLQPPDPRSPGRRGAHRVGDPQRPRPAGAPRPRRPRRDRLGPGDPRGDRAGGAALRRHRDPPATPATRCSGAGRGSATAGSSPRPTAGPTSPRCCRPSGGCPRGRSCSPPGAASSSTRWSSGSTTP